MASHNLERVQDRNLIMPLVGFWIASSFISIGPAPHITPFSHKYGLVIVKQRNPAAHETALNAVGDQRGKTPKQPNRRNLDSISAANLFGCGKPSLLWGNFELGWVEVPVKWGSAAFCMTPAMETSYQVCCTYYRWSELTHCVSMVGLSLRTRWVNW